MRFRVRKIYPENFIFKTRPTFSFLRNLYSELPLKSEKIHTLNISSKLSDSHTPKSYLRMEKSCRAEKYCSTETFLRNLKRKILHVRIATQTKTHCESREHNTV